LKKYVIVLLAISCLVGRTSAYTPITASNGQIPSWASMPVSFWINQSGCPQIPNGSEFQAVQSAFQTWQNVSTASVSFQYNGTTTIPTVGEDGLNVVTFVDGSVPLGSETIAATFSFFNVDGTGTLVIKEADIAFSTSVNFSTSGEPGKYDIQSVATHEIGHLLGLDHSALLSSVMSPYGAAGQLDQRTLSYDDMAAVTWMYPNSLDSSITGIVTLGALPVFGAHVVALDTNGNAVASTVSFPDGSYEIDYLPTGLYRLYAEPLDGPVAEQNIGGTLTAFYTGLQTNFSTTYSGDTTDLRSATTIQVFSGRDTPLGNIHVQAANSLNLTTPANYAAHVAQGSQTTITVGGAGIVPGVAFSSSDPAVSIGPASFAGAIGSNAPTSATLPITVAAATAGAKSISVTANGATSVLSGVLVVTSSPPANIQVAPNSASVDGGIGVSITGQNFRSGAQVYFGGLVASNVQVVSATTIQAILPANSPGTANVVVVNSDGTWGVQQNAFTYSGLPPQISGVTPLSGPPSTLVTISGSEFGSRLANLDVRFNGAPANVVSASPTTITALVPFNATSGPVTVSVAGQLATGPVFTITSAPPSTNLAYTTGQFIDATAGGTALSFGDPDDATAVVPLPFTFTLFDKSYASGSNIAICTNGWISLDAVTTPEYQNGPLPGSTSPGSSRVGIVPSGLIAPFFDDLVLRGNSRVAVRTLGAAPNRQFVVEWLNAGILDEQGNDTGSTITFEAVLYEGTNDVQFLYQSMTGARSDGSSATIGIQNFAQTQAVQSGFNQSIVSTGAILGYHFSNGAYGPLTAAPLAVDTRYAIADKGGLSVITDGSGSTTSTGFATIQPDSGNSTPSGIAMFGYRVNGILVSEAGVPAAPALQSGRIYAEVGPIVNTGVAIANPNSTPAAVMFHFTDSSGADSGAGMITVPANGHIARFLNEDPINGSSNFKGTFSFTSNVAVGVIALRRLNNERGEALLSTLPVTDLSATVPTATGVLPYFTDGAGWQTQIILVNPTDSTMTGNIRFVSPAGQTIGTSPFSIAPASSFKQVTPGTAPALQTGSILIIPDAGNATPAAVGIFSLRTNGVTVSEAAVLPTAGIGLRMYVEASGTPGGLGNIQTGLALTNLNSIGVSVTFDLTDISGKLLASTTMQVAGNALLSKFVNEIFPAVPLPLKGVLHISSPTPVSVAALRGRYNERLDFLMSTTPPTNEEAPPPMVPLVFAQIANGGGFTTQFVLYSGGINQSANGDLHLTYAN
jgi:Matrixin/IPT/TIG domain